VDFYKSDFGCCYPIGQWDVEPVSDFSEVFDAYQNCVFSYFNEDVLSWNVANGTTFERMFNECRVFNSDVSQWNMANATNLSRMFFDCNMFTSDVSEWDVAHATNLSQMFDGCKMFHSDVS
jgi:surface protein